MALTIRCRCGATWDALKATGWTEDVALAALAPLLNPRRSDAKRGLAHADADP
jgi:hypothetical protein